MDFDGNLIGLIVTYIYVAVIILISEKLLKNRPSLARKFTHIMVGNIIFLLPLFTGRVVMTFFVAAPILIFSFLMTKYSPIKINNTITSSGHGLGLFYYAISWTVLAFLFYNQPYIIAVGIVAMSYGDGFASLVGQKFGKHKYTVFGDTKSFEGSITMFLVLIAMLCLSLGYYVFINNTFNMGYPLHILNLFVVIAVSALATVVEGITPKGIDNLTVCFSAVILYILLAI
ncbi:MAG: SEC59/DGK1/VTE5 family protein [Methanobacteriaceae archaeon]|jgi:dolichol kinase|nr:SEC59/DGK1/VTE5 family protein [Candidatus Methanorudis spinitermitis]